MHIGKLAIDEEWISIYILKHRAERFIKDNCYNKQGRLVGVGKQGGAEGQ